MSSYLTTKNAVRLAKLYAAYKVYRVFYPSKVKDLAGATILITGAACGLGKTVALLLAARKDVKQLILWDIQADELSNTVKEIGIIHAAQKVTTSLVDLSDKDSIYATAQSCIEQLGNAAPDVIINNAGIISGGVELLKTEDKRIELESKINTLAHIWITKAFLPMMIQRGTGHFANVSSMAAYVNAPNMIPYAVSKAGAKSFGQGLSAELKLYGHQGIKVSVICPSHIDTKLFQGFHVGPIPTMTPEYVASQIIQAIECETELVQLPRSLLPFVPLIAINEFLGGLHLPQSKSPMGNWVPDQADKIFQEMESKM